jgi:hypothetical protein
MWLTVKHGVKGAYMAVGRISGPLLKDNLLRNGVNLAFETSLLYLDVVNSRVGVNTTSPRYDLDVAGTSRSTNLQVTTQSDIANFTISGSTISSRDSTITLTPSGSNAVVYQARALIDSNLQISSNTIASTVTNSDINLSPNGTGQVVVNSNTLINGNLHATGNITADGNLVLGDANTDGITFNADITSNIIPDVDNTYDLGSSSKSWKTVWAQTLQAVTINWADIVISGHTITTSVTNSNLVLQANGSGIISVPSNSVNISQNLSVGGTLSVTGTSSLGNTNVVGAITQTGNLNLTGNFTTSGTAQVTGNITATGTLQLPQITISGNTIATTPANTDLVLTAAGSGSIVAQDIKVTTNVIASVSANSDITLTPQGTGGVIIDSTHAFKIPVGTDAQRPVSPANGMIRYNTDRSRYEGYTGSYWIQLSGVSDVSGTTYILPEVTPGANDHTLYFYANSTLAATIDSTKLYSPQVNTSSLSISGNTIGTVATNTDINLTTAGTGGIVAGNLRIYNSTITNTQSNAVTEFSETGTGYVRLAGTNGVVIPSGNTLTQRPGAPEVGMVRFNTDFQYVEVYNGTGWASVAGAASGVTSSEAYDIGILSGLIFG